MRGRSVSFTNFSVYFELLITITAVDSEVLLQIHTSRVYLSVARVPHKNEELSNALSKIKQNSFLPEMGGKNHTGQPSLLRTALNLTSRTIAHLSRFFTLYKTPTCTNAHTSPT